jgi:hypothetical protein
MGLNQIKNFPPLPFKSVAGALLFTVFLGPIGLLYATYWGGVLMTVLGFILICTKLIVPIVLFWAGCCIWSVGAVNRFNRKLLNP